MSASGLCIDMDVKVGAAAGTCVGVGTSSWLDMHMHMFQAGTYMDLELCVDTCFRFSLVRWKFTLGGMRLKTLCCSAVFSSACDRSVGSFERASCFGCFVSRIYL